MRIVVPSVIVLVGPSGSGKSTWARRHFADSEIVSSDRLRAAVGLDEYDQRASGDAFAVLNDIVRRRVGRKLTTVIDTLGMNPTDRAAWVALATAAGMPAYAVTFNTDPKVCRARNKERARPVPAKALTAQITKFADVAPELASEGFAEVTEATDQLRLVNRAMAGAAQARDRQQAEPRRLDFGLQIAVFNFTGSPQATGERLVEIAQAAEEVGFSSLWVMDHFMQIPQVGPEWWDMPEAYTTLAYLAAATRRITLGTLVTGVGYRNPALLGKMIATLDVLSGGRSMAGLGTGWFERETTGYGYPVPTTKERLDRLEDVLQLLPLLWGPGSPSFEGKAFSVPEAMCYPRPLQDHIPILVGGGGEKRTLRLVAQYADAANFFGDPADVRHKIEVLNEHCAAVRRDPTEITITHLGPALVANDQSDLERRIAAIKPNNVSAAQFGATMNAGTIEDQIGRFRTLAEAGVQAAIVSPVAISDASGVHRLAPIIDAFS
jgi:F420-dependent oxidoreductase-like protein